jgi:hypothetical protein
LFGEFGKALKQLVLFGTQEVDQGNSAAPESSFSRQEHCKGRIISHIFIAHLRRHQHTGIHHYKIYKSMRRLVGVSADHNFPGVPAQLSTPLQSLPPNHQY